MKQVIHGTLLQLQLAVLQHRIIPDIRHVPFDEIPANLLRNLAGLDDVVGASLVVGLGVGDYVQDVGLQIELGVDAKSEMSFGLIQIRREAGQS